MSNPTRAQVQTAWSDRIKILNNIRLFGNVNATNFLGLLDTAEQSFRGDYEDEDGAAIQALRANLAGNVSQGLAQSIQRPWLKQYLKSVIGRTSLQSDEEMWDDLRSYFFDNALRVDSRRMTFGSVAAGGSNVGTSQIQRLTTDKWNFDIESGYGDSKLIECVLDANSGTGFGQESWSIQGQARARDELERSGSGLIGGLQGLTIDDSIISNAGFRSFGGSASSPTSIVNWTSSATVDSTTYTFDSTNYFRKAPSDGSTSYAMNIKASTTLTQKLSDTGVSLDPNVPYLTAIVWNREVGFASGTLTVRMGAIYASVTVAAQTGWIVTLVPNPIGQSCWYRNFDEQDLDTQIVWTRTGGDLLIGEVLFVPGTSFDGLWHWVLPTSTATYVAPRRDDSFTAVDGESSSGGVNQRWFARTNFAGPFSYLPHSNGSSITWADA